MKNGTQENRKLILFRKLWEFDCAEIKTMEGWMAGVDEAGRGPLAGPVVASAVIVFQPEALPGVNDSKKLSSSQREKLFGIIARSSLVGIGVVDEKQIDELNIYEATRLAMKKAVLNLPHTPELLLIDGPMKVDLSLEQKSVIQGDQKSLSIAAASVVAKVFRDGWMQRLHELYPAYSFNRHKGYGTAEHMETLQTIGPSPVHRRSFAPVRESEQFVLAKTSL
jgi:ribonuclease HII